MKNYKNIFSVKNKVCVVTGDVEVLVLFYLKQFIYGGKVIILDKMKRQILKRK